MSPSQAPLCHCTLRTVTDRPEGTLRSLRYAFGGDHPSQTTHQAMSSQQELELKQTKGRISTAAPQILAYLAHCLRPILHIACPNPMLSYSKGSRGLFVPSRVIGIFTDRRLLGLQFKASREMTSPLNLPAPGRCQAVYRFFRIRTALCFW